MNARKDAVPANADPVIVAACMGMDAFRMSIGLPTRNYTPELVAKWIAAAASRPLPLQETEGE